MTRFIERRCERVSLFGAAIAVIALGLATMFGCQPGGTTKPKEPPAKPAKQSAQGGTKETPTTDAKSITGLEVLGRMVAAYHNASSYVDVGTVRMLAEADGKTVQDETVNFSLAFVRPNKLRIRAYGAEVVSDGEKLYAYRRDIPGQIFSRAAPEQLTIRNVQPDLAVTMALTQGFAGAMPQVPLLFGKDQLDGLVRDLGEPELAEPGQIGGRDCYRVKLKGPDGIATAWIDQKTYVLRRMVLPTDSLRKAMSQDTAITNISVVADFTGAELNGKVDPNAFKFDVPQDAKLVEYLVPPHMGQLLNKKVPEFKFTDLPGKPVTSESITGKTAVILFWSVRYDSCRQVLQNLEEVYQKYKDNPKVAFYAVCVDPPQLKNVDLEKAVADLKVSVPVLRDIDMSGVVFNMSEPPVMFIVNDKGIVQHCEAGVNPKFVQSLQTKLEKVLAGADIYDEPMKQYLDQVEELRQFAKLSETAATEPAAGDGAVVKDVQLPEVKTAERSEPTTFKLAPLWKCSEVKMPGNILVVSEKAGPARVYVVDSWNSVAEVGLDGKLIARHKLNLDPKEVVGSLRTAVGADGKRYFVVFLTSQQRCHLLDENWKPVIDYPEDALKNPHSGISDVRLGDLDGDGKLKMYISYWSVVGVQAVSLDGKRIWMNRSDVSNVGSLAIGDAGPQGQRDLLCTNHTGNIVALNARGEKQGDITLRGQLLNYIASADLRGDGKSLLCGLAAVKAGDNIAIGISLKGDAPMWTYPLPTGIQPQPIEPIISGRITRNGDGQWLLPGPDGSIHIISADGKPLDKFNYGAVLQGMATVEIDGQPAMVVSSAKGLEAWKIQ